MYEPKPVDTSGISLGPEIEALIEALAQHVHDIWAQQRIADGWVYGPERHDGRKEHPSLVPYAELSDSEKVYDRETASATLKLIQALGYRIVRA